MIANMRQSVLLLMFLDGGVCVACIAVVVFFAFFIYIVWCE